jgi:hypothetical protein
MPAAGTSQFSALMFTKTFCLPALAVCLLVSPVSAATIVFSTDFNSSTPAEFSSGASRESVQGYEGLGHAGNQFSGSFLRNAGAFPDLTITLTLTGLPDHNRLSLGFLLAIIDTWDGSGGSGPDFFNVILDGTTIFSETFDTQEFGADQSYVPAPNVLLTPRIDRGFNFVNNTDDGYDMSLEPRFQNIPHTGSTAVIQWNASGAGLESTLNESWAIDNVIVTVSTVPEPATLTLLAVGAPLLTYVVRRRQTQRGRVTQRAAG